MFTNNINLKASINNYGDEKNLKNMLSEVMTYFNDFKQIQFEFNDILNCFKEQNKIIDFYTNVLTSTDGTRSIAVVIKTVHNNIDYMFFDLSDNIENK